jgi:hypothetical protein
VRVNNEIENLLKSELIAESNKKQTKENKNNNQQSTVEKSEVSLKNDNEEPLKKIKIQSVSTETTENPNPSSNRPAHTFQVSYDHFSISFYSLL